MKPQPILAVLAICLLAAPASGAAQTVQTTVTLVVPLNLTQISPEVTKVLVTCAIKSIALTGKSQGTMMQEVIPLSGGQLVTTVTLVFPVTGLDNPVGKDATVTCSLSGFSPQSEKWFQFEDNSASLAFRTKPSLPSISASFVW